ncbi:non-homologous end-joining DNA ligase [Aeromicrobium sp. CF3.5]|uniref:non-homologous end-joining DNA ligase n=1 Tax=Aeromicrobium sp. CF3.5 TaxID=3373078 RepID=UPI003EE425AB
MAGPTASQTVTLGGHRLRLTHPDKVLYPETGTTKAEIIAYLVTIAPVLLPHLAGRIVTRKRWVHGVGTPARPGEVFFEKNLPPSAPRWIRRHRIAHDRHEAEYPLVEHAADLAWLGQVGALELHTPQWRVTDGPADQPRPDRLVLDLDPGPGVGLAECASVAHEARAMLGEVGLEALPVTSGSKGLHLYAALDGTHDTEYVNAFARTLAEALQSQLPDLVVSSMSKSVRRGKVLVDWSQNNGNKTTISPYSLRGTVLPHVAAPRMWDEIDDDLAQLMFTEVLERVETSGDPLADLGHRPHPEQVTVSGTEVQLASVGRESTVRSADDWAYEMKWDGIRAVAHVHDDGARLTSRNGHDLTVSYPEICEALAADPTLTGTALDGEIVAFGSDGAPDFGLLQHRMGVTSARDVAAAARQAPAHLLVFDLLAQRDQDLREQPYTARREALAALDIGDDPEAIVRVPPAFDGALDEAVAHSLEQGLEGVIAKRCSAVYRSGRGSSWVKIKHQRTQDVVVCGWSPGRGARAESIGSLVVAVHREDRLSYAGRVGTGFTDAALQRLTTALNPLEIAESPLVDVPADVARTARWVEPVIVGEVTFAEWTASGQLRHASWRGVRHDVPASGVRP